MNNNEDHKNHHLSSDYLYLEKLKFNPELRKGWLNFFISNFRVVLLLIALLSLWGITSFNKLPRESNPEVKIPIAVVATVYPGASPADVEELITKKVETGLSGLKDVHKISSNSANSMSIVTIEFESKANLDDSLRSLRDKVNDLKTNLPAESNDPIVKEISFDDTPIWNASLIGPYDDIALRKNAEDIKDELEKVPGIREVRISGGEEVEYEVAYDPQKLVSYGLSATQANQLIAATNIAIPSGSFEGQEYSYPVRTDGRFFEVEKLANIPLTHTSNGAVIFLKDVATVREKGIKKTIYSRLSSAGTKPQNDITIQIIKKTGSSIIDTVKTAESRLDEMLKTMPQGLAYHVTVDYSKQINDDFSRLGHDFLLTIILVFLVLFLIVGLKEALVAGLAVPLVFFATFGIMDMTGTTLNFLSIFSLILALGLLVDDAIVVVSATKQYLKTGKFTPEEAVLLVLNDFKVVLTTTTLATVWAFLPLLMSTGIIGSFIKSIPITVSVTLVASLVIALIINHPLAAVLERIRFTKKVFYASQAIILILGFSGFASASPFIRFGILWLAILIIIYSWYWYHAKGKSKLEKNTVLVAREWEDDELIKKKLKEQGTHEDDSLANRLMHGIIKFDVFLPIYDKYLRRLLATRKSRFKTLAVVFMLFVAAVALPVTGVVRSEFFPLSNSDTLYINIKAANGLNLNQTDKIVQKVEEKLLTYPEIDSFSTLVGLPGGSKLSTVSNETSHLASITIKLQDKKYRKIKSYDLAEKIRNDLNFINKEAEIIVDAPSSGPPSGSAFEGRISGDDLKTLDLIAQELKPKLESIPGVINPSISLKQSSAEYSFSLDQTRMEFYGLNSAYVGSALRMAISGTEVTKVIKDGKEIKVIAKFDPEKISDLQAVQNIQIINLKGQPVFLKDVAKIELKPSVESISRVDQKRVVVLSASVDSTTNSTLVLKEFQKLTKDYKFPSGYEIAYGGENEENANSVMSIINAMAVAGLLIVSTLIIQFNSFRKALIVLVTIPLALIGVFFGMAIFQINLSFPGLIGILALFGIVVKNAIILIDKINLNLKSGIEFRNAIVDAGKSRLEAIFITSICTIFGIIPITLSDETWRALGSAVIFGLILSSFLTLFIVPTLFMALVPEKKASKL